MASTSSPPKAGPSGRPSSNGISEVDESRLVAPDYGMPGSKGMESPFKPLFWLLLPFFFCLAYGIATR